jgi:pimeloyl-ACP methyl ester carboxylesterase
MKPVLVLIPGMLNDASVWRDVAPAMRLCADVRIADVLTQSSMADMRRDAWALLADVPPEVPVFLAGFSMGGYVAIDMLAHPVRPVQGVALLSTSGKGESPEGMAAREKTIAAMQADFAKVVEGVIKWGTVSASPALADRLRQMMLGIGPQAAVRQIRAVMGRGEHRDVLAQLKVPVRILCGRQDRVTPPELSELLLQWIPGARLSLIEDAGHMLPCEQPAVVAQTLHELINSFLMETSNEKT